MTAPTELLIGGVFVGMALWYGYLTATALRLRWSLRGVDADDHSRWVDSKPAAVSGRVVVEEPAPASDAVVGDTDPPVGAYVWRARIPGGRRWLNVDEGRLEPGMRTFASGVESGRFAVVDGGRPVTIDPEWLADATDCTPLSELTFGGTTTTGLAPTYLWDSPYLSVDGETVERSPEALAAVVETASPDTDLSRYGFETRPVREGDTLTVRGEFVEEDGDPIIRGTDATPLVITDSDLNDVRRGLLTRTAANGIRAAGGLAFGVFLLS